MAIIHDRATDRLAGRYRLLTSISEVRVRQSGPRRLAIFVASAVLAGVALAAGTARTEQSWDGVARVLAVGDVHGDYDQFLAVLQAGGVVDRRGRWNGGR